MNDYLNLYFREIVYHNPSTKEDSACGVFSYEAITMEEAQLGNLYLISKISNLNSKKRKSFTFFTDLLASAIKRDFYSNPQRNTLTALESSLQGANIYLKDFAKKGHKEWIGNLDFGCLAFSGNKIHIGQTGNILFYLFRNQTLSNVTKKFSNRDKQSQLTKTFSNIASGEVQENDKLIITTYDLLKIISVQKLKELISSPTGEKLYEHIKEKLKEKKIDSLACLILEAKTNKSVKEKNQEVIIENKIKSTILNLEEIINSRLTMPLIKIQSVKYFLIFFLMTILILSPYFVQKIFYESKIAKADNFIKRADDIIENSEISLTYQNQNDAHKFLQQANNLITAAGIFLSKLPILVKQEPIERLETTIQKLKDQENSLNNIVIINEPEEISDLSKNTYTFNPRGILKLENNLYLYELNSGFIYQIDLNDSNKPTLTFLSSKDNFKLGTVLENSIALLSTPEKIYVYSKIENYNTYLLRPNIENTLFIKDMANYNNSIYFLNTEKLDIIKYDPQEKVLNGSSWLDSKYKEELKDAKSLAVDGNVYVLKSDGTIAEFIQGKKSRDIKPKINPALNSGKEIFTKPEMKNLYVLDPENKRIISINKKENSTIQYFSEYFDSLDDFWVTQDEKNIYILNKQKIYKIDI